MTSSYPIKALFEPQRNTVEPSSLGDVRVFHYSLPIWHETRDGQEEEANELASLKLLLKGGEVLVSKLNPEKGAVVLAKPNTLPVIASTEFIALKPRFADARFGYWLMQSASVRFQLESSVESVTNSHKRARVDRFLASRVSVPDPEIQKAIADFLDRETARIDQLIEKKARMIEITSHHWERFAFDAFSGRFSAGEAAQKLLHDFLPAIPSHWTLPKLKFLVSQVTVGIVVTPAAYYVDTGIPAVRATNIRPMHMRNDDFVFISDEGHRINSKSEMRAGDIVAVRTGQPGTACVVPKELHGANCIDVILIRQTKKYLSELLALFLNSSAAKAQYQKGASGAIQQHFNVSTAGNLLVPTPPIDEQDKLLGLLQAERDRVSKIIEVTSRSIDRLREFRGALITAAVTGRIDVKTWSKQGQTDRRLDQIKEDMALQEARA